jgi:hypothetical protein
MGEAMGFWSNLRAASVTSTAAALIDKNLKAAQADGMPAPSGDTRKLSEALVMELWGSIPALAQQKAKPQVALVAVAAVAHGIRHLDASGKREFSERLVPCLRTFLAFDCPKLVNVARLAPIDIELFAIARSVFEARKPILPKEFSEEVARESKPNLRHEGESWKKHLADPSFRRLPSMPDLEAKAPATTYQAGALYIAFYEAPPAGPYPCLFAASVYDSAAQKLLWVFALEESFDGSAFFCLFERTGARANMGTLSADASSFERAVLDHVCKAAGLPLEAVQEAAT